MRDAVLYDKIIRWWVGSEPEFVIDSERYIRIKRDNIILFEYTSSSLKLGGKLGPKYQDVPAIRILFDGILLKIVS